MRNIFALAIMAAVSFAAEVADTDSEAPETWNNKCFHCINEGNMYCVDGKPVDNQPGQFTWTDTKVGVCMEATCKDQTIKEKDDKKTCELDNLKTCEADGSNKKAFVAFSDCNYEDSRALIPQAKEDEGYSCANLTVEEKDLDEGIKKKDDDGEEIDPPEYEPYFKHVYVGPGEVCMMIIKSADGLDKNIGFGASEWQDDLFVTMTKLEKDDSYDGDTSQISYKNTFYWNREAKDGDLAGRVLVKPEERFQVVIVNNNMTKVQTLKLEYGSAVETVLTYSVLFTTLLLTYAF